jgi:hypothetical protein
MGHGGGNLASDIRFDRGADASRGPLIGGTALSTDRPRRLDFCAPHRKQGPRAKGRVVPEMTWRWIVVASLVLGTANTSVAQQNEFPFDRELILDVRPMSGSKRIPNMDIAANGTIALELWCDRVEGQVVVAGDTITVITGQPSGRPCTADRARGDTELLDALNAVTNWRRQGDALVLVGPRTLRFRVPSN